LRWGKKKALCDPRLSSNPTKKAKKGGAVRTEPKFKLSRGEEKRELKTGVNSEKKREKKAGSRITAQLCGSQRGLYRHGGERTAKKRPDLGTFWEKLQAMGTRGDWGRT